MFISTKDEILNEVIQRTKNFKIGDLGPFTANQIAKRLNISRNLASQYLNELVKEDKLIKINSRPVYFVYKKGIESIYEVSISKNVFLSIDQFTDQLNAQKPILKNFQKAIGYNSSLANCIEQCKAALKYPPSGLPVLLTGQSGTGKSFFARLMYEYARDENVIEKGAPFISINCSKYANNPKQLIALLFGENPNRNPGVGLDDKNGLIRSASGGILFFDEAHNLSPQCQENLFLLMDKGGYHPMGDNSPWHPAQVRLIFATTKNPADVFLRALLRRIPTVVALQPLSERSSEEKEEMILEFFKGEAKRINRGIFISDKVYQALMDANFPGNIGQLKSCVRTGCANAFLHSGQDKTELDIFLYDLPEYLLSSAKLNPTFDQMDETTMIDLYGPTPGNSIDKILALYDSVLNTYEDYKNLKLEQKEMLNQEFANLNSYYDSLIYEKQYSNSKIQAIWAMVRDIFDYISDQYNFPLSNHYDFVISRSIYTQIQVNSEIRLWEERRKNLLEEMLLFFNQNLPKEFIVASQIKSLIKQGLDVQLSRIGFILCLIGVKYYNISEHINDLEGIILCHGYSTASSLVSTANRIIGQHVYDAVDMPPGTSLGEIAKMLRKHLHGIGAYRNVILLVDMGSLESIGEELRDIPNLNIGIVTNVSMRLAVDVGFKICQGLDLQSILNSVKDTENALPATRILANQKKDKAIVFTSETGTGTAEKMSELFLSSLPKAIPIKIISCDYVRLIQNSDQDSILNKYDVLTIIGTSNPNVPHIPFIALEDMISLKEIHQVNAYLSTYFDVKEIQMFDRNILKNFSLQNVMQYLTILNADRLLDYVEEAVNRLQQAMRLRLSGGTILGIYVHMCCLVERLVTQNPIENRLNLDDFVKNHQDFIRQMTESFSAISKYYGVRIPVSEIAYIYDYIVNDKHTDDSIPTDATERREEHDISEKKEL